MCLKNSSIQTKYSKRVSSPLSLLSVPVAFTGLNQVRIGKKKMRPAEHLILGTVTSVALYPMLGALGSATFLTGSVLVDIDHYLDFIYHNRFTDFSFGNMFRYHGAIEKLLNRPEMLNVEIFHTVEFMLPLYALFYYLQSPVLGALFYGILFHIGLDMVSLLRRGLFFKRCNSITEYLIRRKFMARRGLVPAAVYFDALRIINEKKLGADKWHAKRS